LGLCGLALLLQKPAAEDDAVPRDWTAFAWVCGGLLANALLIQHLGFILSCGLCFGLAARGVRLSDVPADAPADAPAGSRLPWPQFAADLALGCAIAAPVYWMFTQLLAVNLPGLTRTGWI
jgi:putative tricarboxylic transport membrane protein